MKTAVVMCTYNGEEFLREQLDSIRMQSAPPDRVIIRDDRSTDNTVSLASSYIEEYGLVGWSIEANEHNLGFAENFHEAVLAVKDACDIVFFSDQDDVWFPNKIERCCEVLGRESSALLLCHEYDILNCQGNFEPAGGKASLGMRGDSSLEFVPAHNGGISIWLGCAMACRESFLQTIEEYRYEGWAHDEWTWKCSQVLGGCYLFHEALIHHRVHGGNLTGHKIHERGRRIAGVRRKMLGDEQALRLARDVNAAAKVQEIFNRSAECERLRLGLLEDKKLGNAVKLLGYLDAYQAKRSWFVELIMTLRGAR